MKRVMIVTGGGRGIGAATAKMAANRGYAVCVNYQRDHASAGSVVTEIQKNGGRAIAVGADVGVEPDVVRLFATVDSELGPVTALVNNAGIIGQKADLVDMDAARLSHIFSINVTGSFLCAREAIRRMSVGRGGGGGAIVNVSSAASHLGSPHEYIDYAATKGAMDTMTIGLAKEVAADGIRVNAVRPGLIYTEIHASGGQIGRVDRLKDVVPMKRGGNAHEVANAILWLASDEASYCTGTFIDVSGGR